MTELETAQTPEIAKTHERVLGNHERIGLPTRSYIKMSQVRRERNKVTDEMKDSIARLQDLISPIHAARMSRESLTTYVDFVNHVWKSQVTFDDFTDYEQADGYYYLIIDGHSRHQAVEELEDEGRLVDELGNPIPAIVWADIHNVSSPEDIIALQLDANIHSQPPRERRAIALVESYQWGLETGQWKNRKEYIEQHSEFGSSALDEAMSFSYLPGEVRSYVLNGHAPYAAGVELGKSVSMLNEYIAAKTGIDIAAMSDAEREKLESATKHRLIVEIQYIAKSKLNSTAAEKRIKAWREQMKADLRSANNPDGQASLLDFMVNAEKQLDEYIRARRQEIVKILRDIGRQPSSAAAALLELAEDFVDPKITSEIYKDFIRANEQARRRIGDKALQGAAIPEDDDQFDAAIYELEDAASILVSQRGHTEADQLVSVDSLSD